VSLDVLTSVSLSLSVSLSVSLSFCLSLSLSVSLYLSRSLSVSLCLSLSLSLSPLSYLNRGDCVIAETFLFSLFFVALLPVLLLTLSYKKTEEKKTLSKRNSLFNPFCFEFTSSLLQHAHLLSLSSSSSISLSLLGTLG
jgi:hypothetical protein